MKVELKKYKNDEEKVVATVRVVDGKVQVEGTIAPLTQQLLDFEYGVSKDKLKESDEEYLKRLEHVFRNPYLWATFVSE